MNERLKLFTVIIAIISAILIGLACVEKKSGTGIGKVAAKVAKSVAGPGNSQ